MAQYIDKDALVAMIKSRMATNKHENPLTAAAYVEDEDVLEAIDTLEVKEVQEEPVNDTQSPVIFYGLTGSVSPKEEPVSEQNLSNVQRTVKNWKKHVNEELGDYINKLSKQFPEVSFAKLSRIAVRVAKWQKQQDKETIEVAEDHAYFAGMEKMKEKMIEWIDSHWREYVNVDADGVVCFGHWKNDLRKAMKDE